MSNNTLKMFLAVSVIAFVPAMAHAQVPNPGDPAPAAPKATNGAPTDAPAKGDAMKAPAAAEPSSKSDDKMMEPKAKHHHHRHHRHHHHH